MLGRTFGKTVTKELLNVVFFPEGRTVLLLCVCVCLLSRATTIPASFAVKQQPVPHSVTETKIGELTVDNALIPMRGHEWRMHECDTWHRANMVDLYNKKRGTNDTATAV